MRARIINWGPRVKGGRTCCVCGRASVQGVHALGLVYLCAEDVRIVFVLEKLTEGVLEFRCC